MLDWIRDRMLVVRDRFVAAWHRISLAEELLLVGILGGLTMVAGAIIGMSFIQHIFLGVFLLMGGTGGLMLYRAKNTPAPPITTESRPTSAIVAEAKEAINQERRDEKNLFAAREYVLVWIRKAHLLSRQKGPPRSDLYTRFHHDLTEALRRVLVEENLKGQFSLLESAKLDAVENTSLEASGALGVDEPFSTFAFPHPYETKLKRCLEVLNNLFDQVTPYDVRDAIHDEEISPET